MNFKKINNYVGIAVLVIATIVFVSTVEPSTSLWDCGEYISTSNKLEVGHPPGAPTFMMLGRLFSAFSAPEDAAYMVNVLSALSSALTILFLFWTITHLAKKLFMREDEELNMGSIIATMGAGMVGAFAYMFSDTFWFSAEEGEVYAMSSFFTAITFWCILKWEDNYTKISSDRWIILIFFLVGISVGVHMLNLLVIPAAAFVFYFKKYEFNIKGFLLTGVTSVAILGFLNSKALPTLLELADKFERAINGMGAGFNTGAFLFFFLLAAILGGAMFFFHRSGRRVLHTITLSLTVLIIGFSTFAMIVVRSNSNPPLDENNPETIPSLMSYFGREQYGDWPIVYGPYWNSPPKSTLGDGKGQGMPLITGNKYFKAYTVLVKGKTKSFQTKFEAEQYLAKIEMPNIEIKEEYVVSGYKLASDYPQVDPSGNVSFRDNKGQTVTLRKKEFDKLYTYFPRMFDTRTDKIKGYLYWSQYKGDRSVRAYHSKIAQGNGYKDMFIPSFSENLTYFKDYQMGWMYFRYFMWNFAGRQNDIQGHDMHYQGDGMLYKGSLTRGNWLSGINFIDAERVGTQDNLPETMQLFEAYNTYYYLPLLLGLIGLIFMVIRAPKDAFSIFLLFFFTGLAIMLYLNPRPFEPRERDYAVAASFYAFAIWIGFSVIAIYKWALTTDMKQLKVGVAAALGAGVFFYVVETVAGGSHVFSYSVLFMAVIGILLIIVPLFVHKSLKNKKMLAYLATGLGLVAPIIMGVQNWDDHDRSDRYFAREVAKNYLNSCDKNAVLFCFGDNDTFPLWYAQEVEGIRTDMKVMNYSLLSSDWHYNQLKRQTYEAPAVKTLLVEPEFRAGTRDIITIQKSQKAISAREFITYLKQGKDQDPRNAIYGYGNAPFNKLYIDVDKEAAIASGLVREDQRNQLVDRIEWTLSGSYISKADLAIIDILAAYEWDRPLCFTSTAIQGSNKGLSKYLQVEGMTAKFVPIVKPSHNREKMYSLLMGEEKDVNGDGTIDGYNWGNVEKEEVFCDYYTMRMIRSARMHYMQLAESYVNAATTLERQPDTTGSNLAIVKDYRQKAVNLLDKQYEVFPIKSCKIDELLNYTALMYYRARDTAKGNERVTELANYYADNVRYFASQNGKYVKEMYQEIGDFMNHFTTLAQGSSDKQFELKNFNPEVYNMMVEKFAKLRTDRDFANLIQSDVYTIGQSRRPGVFPIPFYQDVVPEMLPDRDKDGVSDFIDRCPTVPGTMEKDGCA